MKSFDVAVIGASISGASLSACLGKEGVRVALIDKADFPRRKACGEGLSNIGISALERMGLDIRPLLAKGTPYYSYRVEVGKQTLDFAVGKTKSVRGVGIPRMLLDELLFSHATRCESVTPYLRTRVTGSESSGGTNMLQLDSGEIISAKYLVLADGANSPNATRIGIPNGRKSPPLWGISFVLEGTYLQPLHEVIVMLRDGFEINCTPVSPHQLNITFLTDSVRIKTLQDSDLIGEYLEEAAEKSSFRGSPTGKPLQIGPVNAKRRVYTYGSVMLIGDAAETLDPVAGMGMTHGILMAELASQSLLEIFRGTTDPQTAFDTYSRKAASVSRPLRGFTRLTASLFRNPYRKILLPSLSATFLPRLIRDALNDLQGVHDFATYLPIALLNLVGL